VLAGGEFDDLADVAVLASAGVGVVLRADLDDQVDAAGDQLVGEFGGDVRAGLQCARHEPSDGAAGGVGMGGAERARGGLGGLQHRDHFWAAYLADDDPGDVRAKHRVEQPVQGDLTGRAAIEAAFGRAGPALIRDDPVVPVG